MPRSWLHSSSSASQPAEREQVRGARARSVSMPRRAPPSVQVSCSGSCGIVRHREGLQLAGRRSRSPRRRGRSAAVAGQRRARRSARQVPRLIHSGRPWRRGERQRAADVVAVLVGHEDGVEVGQRQAGARQPAASSRSEKPQSTSTRRRRACRCGASTTVALPPLPLPRLQKRITRRRACAPRRLTSGRRAAG